MMAITVSCEVAALAAAVPFPSFIDDFHLVTRKGALHVIIAPNPAATLPG